MIFTFFSLLSFRSSDRCEYLGAIPDLPHITTRTTNGRFAFSIARAARFRVLQARAESAAQAVARYALEIDPANFSYEIFYPALAREVYRLYDVRPDSQTPIFPDYDLMVSTYDRLRQIDLPFNLHLGYRALLASLFPRFTEVPADKRSFLQFLSFHHISYDRDDYRPVVSPPTSTVPDDAEDRDISDAIDCVELQSDLLSSPPHESNSDRTRRSTTSSEDSIDRLFD